MQTRVVYTAVNTLFFQSSFPFSISWNRTVSPHHPQVVVLWLLLASVGHPRRSSRFQDGAKSKKMKETPTGAKFHACSHICSLDPQPPRAGLVVRGLPWGSPDQSDFNSIWLPSLFRHLVPSLMPTRIILIVHDRYIKVQQHTTHCTRFEAVAPALGAPGQSLRARQMSTNPPRLTDDVM